MTAAAIDRPGSGGSDLPRDVAVQDDGKILVVGTAESPMGHWSAIARFTTSGANDTSFATDGINSVNVLIDTIEESVPWAVAEASAGDIFVAGEGATSAGHDLILIQFAYNGNYEGYLYVAYEDPGSAQTSVENVGRGLSILRGSGLGYYSDRIFVTGDSYDPGLLLGTREMAVVCITGLLNVDTSFGTQGWSLIDFSDYSLFGVGDMDDSGSDIFYDEASGGLVVVGSATDRDSTPLTLAAVAMIDADSGALMQGPGQVWKAHYETLGGHGNKVSGAFDEGGRILLATDTYSNDSYREVVLAGRLLGSSVFSDDFEGGGLGAWTSSSP